MQRSITGRAASHPKLLSHLLSAEARDRPASIPCNGLGDTAMPANCLIEQTERFDAQPRFLSAAGDNFAVLKKGVEDGPKQINPHPRRLVVMRDLWVGCHVYATTVYGGSEREFFVCRVSRFFRIRSRGNSLFGIGDIDLFESRRRLQRR